VAGRVRGVDALTGRNAASGSGGHSVIVQQHERKSRTDGTEVVSQFESRDREANLWYLVTPAMRRADSVQPHLHATPA
jgi:hypothetical protein